MEDKIYPNLPQFGEAFTGKDWAGRFIPSSSKERRRSQGKGECSRGRFGVSRAREDSVVETRNLLDENCFP